MVVPIIVAGARVAATGAARKGAQTAATSAVKGSSVQGVRGGAAVRQSNVQTNAPIRNTPRTAPDKKTSESITRQRRVRGPVTNEYEDESGEQNPQQTQPVKYRIGLLASFIMISLAILLDVTELVIDLAGTLLAGVGVVFGYIKDLFTIILIPLIFLLLRAPFWKGKKAKKKMTMMIGSFVVSLIPWVGAFMPETIASVWITIRLTRKEDKEKVQEQVQNSAITRKKRG